MAPHAILSSLLLGLFTLSVLPAALWSVPVLVGLTVGAYLTPRRAAAVSPLVWCAVLALHMLPFEAFSPDYNETVYQADVAARTHTDLLSVAIGAALSALVGVFAASSIPWSAASRRRAAQGILTLLVCGFWWRVNQVSPDLLTAVDREPEVGHYHFDGQITIKALYLAQRGADYFHAFWDAAQGDARNFGSMEGQSLRNPALFSFWRLLPTVSSVCVTGWLLVSAAMVTSFVVLDRLGRQPLLSCWVAAGIAGVSVYSFSNYWMFINDPWAGSLLAIAAALLLLPRFATAAAALAAVTFWCRELCGLLPLCLLVLHSRQRRWRPFIVSAAGLLVAAGLYQYTRMQCAEVLHFSSLGITYRLKFSPAFAFRCLHFGQMFVPARDLVLPLLVPLHVYGLLRFRNTRPELATLLAHNLLLWSAFVCLGGGAAYYGWNWLPAALVAAGATLAGSFPQPVRRSVATGLNQKSRPD